eukprot:471068-Prymnesium_polylepis.1
MCIRDSHYISHIAFHTNLDISREESLVPGALSGRRRGVSVSRCSRATTWSSEGVAAAGGALGSRGESTGAVPGRAVGARSVVPQRQRMAASLLLLGADRESPAGSRRVMAAPLPVREQLILPGSRGASPADPVQGQACSPWVFLFRSSGSNRSSSPVSAPGASLTVCAGTAQWRVLAVLVRVLAAVLAAGASAAMCTASRGREGARCWGGAKWRGAARERTSIVAT